LDSIVLTPPPLLPPLNLYNGLNLASDTLILKMATALYGEATEDLQCIMWLNPKNLKHILGTGIKNLRTRISYVFLISLHSAHFIISYWCIQSLDFPLAKSSSCISLLLIYVTHSVRTHRKFLTSIKLKEFSDVLSIAQHEI